MARRQYHDYIVDAAKLLINWTKMVVAFGYEHGSYIKNIQCYEIGRSSFSKSTKQDYLSQVLVVSEILL